MAKTPESNENLDHAVETKALQDEITKLQAKITEGEAREEQLKAQITEGEAREEQLKAQITEGEKQLEDLKAAAAQAPAAPVAPVEENVLVVSNTAYSYLIENVRITPDTPVRMVRRKGNLLDSHMEAGLIVKYEA